ncbi:hypothetical protein ACFWWS_39200 [Streptomyces sp. NPDC059083]|uniref:hypothetical protein n=1 Tax=Streptomyces sp. NPDC059083 TaxID=3346721 RepID=UPI00368E9AC3
MTTPSRARLRAALSDRAEITVAPGVFDGLSASLVRRLDFPAAYLTGAGVAASGFGLPDIGLVTQTEMVERAPGCWCASSATSRCSPTPTPDTATAPPAIRRHPRR